MGIHIEKMGKVEVIRINRKREKRDTGLSLKNILTKITTFTSPSAEVVQWKEVATMIKNEIGNYEYKILLPDRKYHIYPKKAIEKLLKKDETDKLKYHKETWDCDDFALVTNGNLQRMTFPDGLCFGELWFYHKEEGWGHAINLFIAKEDGKKKVYVCEPQTDEIMQYNKEKWKAAMIKI